MCELQAGVAHVLLFAQRTSATGAARCPPARARPPRGFRNGDACSCPRPCAPAVEYAQSRTLRQS
eukprot:5144006-Alexandrium_andersonii.AAC.1